MKRVSRSCDYVLRWHEQPLISLKFKTNHKCGSAHAIYRLFFFSGEILDSSFVSRKKKSKL